MNTSELTQPEPINAAQTRRGIILQDALFVGLVVMLSLVPYVFRLGLYSDDWIFLSLLNQSSDQSLVGLMKALYEGDVVIRQRPVQMVYLAVLYDLFGLSPLSFHIANALCLAAISVVFYLTLREIWMRRLLVLALPLVYLLLPHYSTDRFWIAAHQANLSMVFYFLSLLGLSRFYHPPIAAFQIPEYAGILHIVTPRFVRAAHAQGLQVHVWTVNEVEDMRRLMEWGVDGLFTDYPERLVKLLVVT